MGDIRVLTIRRGKEGDVIECTLTTRPLDTSKRPQQLDGPTRPPVHYKALSYHWGSLGEEVAIRISTPVIAFARDFYVSPNLHATLEQSRFLEGTRTLWIDAIYIDIQANSIHKCPSCLTSIRQPHMYGMAWTTKQDLLGLGPDDTKRQDLICRLYRCSEQIISRPMKFKDGKAKFYHFVGVSYILGIMDGEALKSQRVKTQNRVSLRFILDSVRMECFSESITCHSNSKRCRNRVAEFCIAKSDVNP